MDTDLIYVGPEFLNVTRILPSGLKPTSNDSGFREIRHKLIRGVVSDLIKLRSWNLNDFMKCYFHILDISSMYQRVRYGHGNVLSVWVFNFLIVFFYFQWHPLETRWLMLCLAPLLTYSPDLFQYRVICHPFVVVICPSSLFQIK